jgi:hypothetical protein
METMRVRFDGQVFVPEGPVDLPVGYVAEIPVRPPAATPTSRAPLLELLKVLDQFPSNPDWPPDGAEQHDHYLYGTPKRP